MNDPKEQCYKQFETGDYLAKLRASKNIRLTDAARKIGISPPYLKEIEKGMKLPSDLLVRSIANFYEISEDDLFSGWGKIPLLAREQFEAVPDIQRVFADIMRQNISEDEKQHIFDEFTELYKRFLQRRNKKKDSD